MSDDTPQEDLLQEPTPEEKKKLTNEQFASLFKVEQKTSLDLSKFKTKEEIIEAFGLFKDSPDALLALTQALVSAQSVTDEGGVTNEAGLKALRRRQDQPYYTKERANNLKPILDKMMIDRKDRAFKCADYGYKIRPSTIRNMLAQGLQFLIDNDPTHKYILFRREVTFSLREWGVEAVFNRDTSFKLIDHVLEEKASYNDVKAVVELFIEKALPGRKLDLPGHEDDNEYFCRPFSLTREEITDLESFLDECGGLIYMIIEDRLSIKKEALKKKGGLNED